VIVLSHLPVSGASSEGTKLKNLVDAIATVRDEGVAGDPSRGIHSVSIRTLMLGVQPPYTAGALSDVAGMGLHEDFEVLSAGALADGVVHAQIQYWQGSSAGASIGIVANDYASGDGEESQGQFLRMVGGATNSGATIKIRLYGRPDARYLLRFRAKTDAAQAIAVSNTVYFKAANELGTGTDALSMYYVTSFPSSATWSWINIPVFYPWWAHSIDVGIKSLATTTLDIDRIRLWPA